MKTDCNWFVEWSKKSFWCWAYLIVAFLITFFYILRLLIKGILPNEMITFTLYCLFLVIIPLILLMWYFKISLKANFILTAMRKEAFVNGHFKKNIQEILGISKAENIGELFEPLNWTSYHTDALIKIFLHCKARSFLEGWSKIEKSIDADEKEMRDEKPNTNTEKEISTLLLRKKNFKIEKEKAREFFWKIVNLNKQNKKTGWDIKLFYSLKIDPIIELFETDK